jgi:hypothetical protein
MSRCSRAEKGHRTLQKCLNFVPVEYPRTDAYSSALFLSSLRRSRHQRADADPSSLSLKALRCIWYIISSEFTHRCSQAINVGILPVSFGRLFHQKYEGDVTILPPITKTTLPQVKSLDHLSRHKNPVHAAFIAIKSALSDQSSSNLPVFTFTYSGSPLQALANPSIASLRQFILTAERRTWPTIGLIRSQCQIETTLDECVRHLAQVMI